AVAWRVGGRGFPFPRRSRAYEVPSQEPQGGYSCLGRLGLTTRPEERADLPSTLPPRLTRPTEPVPAGGRQRRAAGSLMVVGDVALTASSTEGDPTCKTPPSRSSTASPAATSRARSTSRSRSSSTSAGASKA